jgi:eukaryotic-like serine/threonine-protein kinase
MSAETSKPGSPAGANPGESTPAPATWRPPACPTERDGALSAAAAPAPGAQTVSFGAVADPAPMSGPFRRGQVVGGAYEITGVLGAGGMGVVYEAHDVLLDRSVAIKAPLFPDQAQTLRNEAQAMAAVHHPNVVTVYAVGHEGPADFIVMERVFGMTLQDRIQEAWEARVPIPLEEALDLLVAVTVHRAGAAHRDLKSANVMISGERVVLADFGLATPEVSLHAGGPFAGSADYMAPELILGTIQTGRGHLADLYALGVVAFEVITGRRPYPFETPRAVLRAHLDHPVPDVRSYRADTSDELAELVHELLAKAPEERPDSAESVLWRLAALRADLPGTGGAAPLSVLLVDDDPEVGRMLQHHLAWALPRLAAEAIADPAEALRRMERKAYDIAVVDLNMPGMNGVELCMGVADLPARTRPVIVVMSAHADPRDVDVLHALGVRAFVPKDERLVPHLCEVIGDVRRARRAASPAAHRG